MDDNHRLYSELLWETMQYITNQEH